MSGWVRCVGLRGTRGFIEGAADMPIPELLKQVGDNTGNLVFQHAACRLVSADTRTIGPGCELYNDARQIAAQCGAVIFPAANHISPAMDLGGVGRLFAALPVPVVILGIGAQATDCSENSLNRLAGELGQQGGFLEFVGSLRQKAIPVGVRGAFTQRLLDRFDVPSKVIGCPSLLQSTVAALGTLIEDKFRRVVERLRRGETLRVALAAASPWDPPAVLAVERCLVIEHQAHQGPLIQQSGGEAVVAHAAGRPLPIREKKALMLRYAQQLNTGWALEDVARYLDDRATIFFDVEAWQRSLAQCDLCIGTRFHGTSLALQSGIPAITIAHDSRTEELCQSLAMPYLTARAFLQDPSFLTAVEGAGFDAARFDRNRGACARTVRTMLQACRIAPSTSLTGLCGVGDAHVVSPTTSDHQVETARTSEHLDTSVRDET